MKSTIYHSCKILAATAVITALSFSLTLPDTHAQDPPPQAQKAQPENSQPENSQAEKPQKIDSPRKTGRTRPSEARSNLPENIALPESASPKATIRQLDPDKIAELRSRIRTDRGSRMRDSQFQEERAKNIRRLVQIERVRTLAEQNNNTVLLERAATLKDREMQRHVRKLAQLRKDAPARRKLNQGKRLEKTETSQKNEQAPQ